MAAQFYNDQESKLLPKGRMFLHQYLIWSQYKTKLFITGFKFIKWVKLL